MNEWFLLTSPQNWDSYGFATIFFKSRVNKRFYENFVRAFSYKKASGGAGFKKSSLRMRDYFFEKARK